MNTLGIMHENGEGVVTDLTAARQWYEKAAATGHRGAMYNLGRSYEGGAGRVASMELAVSWLQRAEAAGLADAALTLGWYFETGAGGVKKDKVKAEHWYGKAVSRGQPTAKHNLALFLLAKDESPVAHARAIQLLVEAAESGLTLAMNTLGKSYEDGRGVRKDFKEARRWYEKAADKGEPEAMFSLGWMFEHGNGVSRDYKAARAWYDKSASAGNTQAYVAIGRLYHGGLGVGRDFDAARTYFEKAADAGDSHGMNWLGLLYARGNGVPRDLASARRWYKKASDLGNEVASKNYSELLQWERSDKRREGQSGVSNEGVKAANRCNGMWQICLSRCNQDYNCAVGCMYNARC